MASRAWGIFCAGKKARSCIEPSGLIYANPPAIGLLLIAALVIFIQQRVHPNYGTSWLIAASASIAAWLMVLILRFRLPTTLAVLSWTKPILICSGISLFFSTIIPGRTSWLY